MSPLIAPVTVFRAANGTIDHTSVLKTVEQRWHLDPLTARDKAAASLADVLTLVKARGDDPLQGVEVPVSNMMHPKQDQPSELDHIHAWRLSQLPVGKAYGTFGHRPPDLPTSAALSDYIRSRSAAWKQHRWHRHALQLMSSPNLRPPYRQGRGHTRD